MLPTPCTAHINPTRIYEPAEDSFLLLDTLSSAPQVQFLTRRFATPPNPPTALIPPPPSPSPAPSPPPLILEVGSGSGVVLAFLTAHAATLFGRADVLGLGTDVNRYACAATTRTVKQACRTPRARVDGAAMVAHDDAGAGDDDGRLLAVLNADLASPLKAGSVDVLVFNPPYVPTAELPARAGGVGGATFEEEEEEEEEEEARLLELSYAGGADGMEVTNRLLDQIPHVLSLDRGVAYVLLCAQNRPEDVIQRVRRWGPAWAVTVAGRSEKRGGWERLQVLRICRV